MQNYHVELEDVELEANRSFRVEANITEWVTETYYDGEYTYNEDVEVTHMSVYDEPTQTWKELSPEDFKLTSTRHLDKITELIREKAIESVLSKEI